MAADEFFGCLLTSFGMPLVLILFTIILYPLRIITLIISASFWLVSLLLSSVLWFAVVPLKEKLAFSVVFSVIFQEIMRFAFIIFLHKIYNGIKLILLDLQDNGVSQTNHVNIDINNVADCDNNTSIDDTFDGNNPLIIKTNADDIFNVTMFAYVGGMGFGIMSGLFATLSILVDLNGPGTLGYYGQPHNFINLYAAQTLLVILNNVAYTVIMSRSFQRRSFLKIAFIVGLHMLYACLTLINALEFPGPEIIIAVNTLLCVASCMWAFIESGGKWRMITWAISLNVRGYLHNIGYIFKKNQMNDL